MGRFDAIVVGRRCAGAPLAAHLARAGLSVAVLDRVGFPSDTLSTHIMESGTLAALDRLGVRAAVAAVGAPFLREASAVLGGVDLSHTMDGEIFCVRRTVLDPLRLARAVGALVRPSRGAALGQAREMMREELARRRMARHPVYEAA